MRILLCAALVVGVCAAQEEGGGGGGGRGGGRGGRGGRGGAASTRDFLGLGANGAAPDEAAAKKGEPLYKQNCGTCHGERARGAQAPNLVRSVVVLHDEKGEEIGPVIKNGRPPGMPAFPSLSRKTSTTSASTSRCRSSWPRIAEPTGPPTRRRATRPRGDAKKGEAFFAPATARAATRRPAISPKMGAKFPQAATLQSRWLWPATPGPQKATVTTAAGERSLEPCSVLNDFDVSLTDAAGNYQYWPEVEVKVEVEDKLAGHRALLPNTRTTTSTT